ncbi:uncharacterized protein LOC120364004 [Saimiri boliviensis]|uniref:uncharacterized protein LOC120364004 n=1 Tax=Saimiri boliviensis TaxID=27679 RepID=UPI003D77B287
MPSSLPLFKAMSMAQKRPYQVSGHRAICPFLLPPPLAPGPLGFRKSGKSKRVVSFVCAIPQQFPSLTLTLLGILGSPSKGNPSGHRSCPRDARPPPPTLACPRTLNRSSESEPRRADGAAGRPSVRPSSARPRGARSVLPPRPQTLRAASETAAPKQKGDSGRWRPEEGGDRRRGGEGWGEGEGGESRLEARANSAALPRVPARQDRPAPPSRGPGAPQPSPRLLLRAASHLAGAPARWRSVREARGRRRPGSQGAREPPGLLPGTAASPALPPPVRPRRRHLTPPWLERRAGELASRRCLASWTPSSSCLFRDANGVKLRKFAKRGAARSTAPEPGSEDRGVRGKPRQLRWGSRVADSPSHLPIPHSCSAETGWWRSSETVFRRGRNGLRVPGI